MFHNLSKLVHRLCGLATLVCWFHGLSTFVCWFHELSTLVRWCHGLSTPVCWFHGLSTLVRWLHGLSTLVCWFHGLSTLVSWFHGLSTLVCWFNGLNRCLLCALPWEIFRFWLFGCIAFDGMQHYVRNHVKSLLCAQVLAVPATVILFELGAAWPGSNGSYGASNGASNGANMSNSVFRSKHPRLFRSTDWTVWFALALCTLGLSIYNARVLLEIQAMEQLEVLEALEELESGSCSVGDSVSTRSGIRQWSSDSVGAGGGGGAKYGGV